MNTSHVVFRRRNRALLTVSKTVFYTLLGAGLMALPLGIALAGKAMGL